MTAWLRSSPASLSTPITTSAKYLPPEERTRSARTSVTPGTDDTTARRFASAPAGALSISALTLERAEPHGAEDDEHGHEERGDRIGAGVAERRQREPRHDGDGAGEVDTEVHRVGSECSAALAARGARRRGGARGVDHEHHGEQRHRVPGRLHLSAAAAQAHDRRDRDPGRQQHQDRGLAQRREVLRLAVAIGMLRIGRAVGDAHGPQREQRSGRVDAGVHGLGEDAEAAGREADEELDRDQGERRAQREERGAPCHRHGPDRTRTAQPRPSRLDGG